MGTSEKAAGWIRYALWGMVGGVVVVVGAAVLYFTVFTVSVRIDGRTVRESSRTSVGDLFAQKALSGRAGDLVAVHSRKVLKAGGGQKPYAIVNGHHAEASELLHNGDVIVAHTGTDTVEPVLRRDDTIPFDVQFDGAGPIETIETTGVPGTRRVHYGALSDEVVSRAVLTSPTAQVVRRSMPPAGAKLIALTFDDGPWPGQTEAILKILQANHVTATFFEIGEQARRNPRLSRMTANAGMLIGNHTETHPLHLNRLPAATVKRQIVQAEQNITNASGTRPRYFRPPGGNTSPDMFPVLTQLGLRWLEWDIDTDDWQRPPAATIVQRVVTQARPGAVVLMHEGGGDRSHTIAALPVIIAKLRAKGYVFVTLDGLARLPHVMG